LERTACFGACPVYTVSIKDDGSIIYDGQHFVTINGEQTGEMDPALVQQMLENFDAVGYFGWDDAYTDQSISDLPSVITSVTYNGETKRIERYAGDASAPLALAFLEQWIDEMTNTANWTGVQPHVSAIATGSVSPVVTLQRGACFGQCPVYSIALFADGTLIYTGIANVDDIGVHVSSVDPAMLTSIVTRAQGNGYFGWQDSYNNRVISDQATVTTTIATENQYKRILRYDGDPNAPVGLLWVEQSISSLVFPPMAS
jgi:hypothetical protein